MATTIGATATRVLSEPAVRGTSELEAISTISSTIAAGHPARRVLTRILETITELATASHSVLCVSRGEAAAIMGDPDVEAEAALSPLARVANEGPNVDEIRDWEGTCEPLPSGDGRRLLLPQQRGGIVVVNAAPHVLCGSARQQALRILADLASGEVERANKLAEAERRKGALEETRTRLREQNVLLRELAVVDELTGLHNRRYFERQLAYELDRLSRYKRPLTIAVLDVDHFKHFNDTWGHDVGDIVLRRLADVARTALRRVDLLARFGGEEFVVLMPETPADGGLAAIERLRTSICDTDFVAGERSVTVTISAGIATALADFCGDAQSLFRRADQALYRAKAAGRNQVVAEADPSATTEGGNNGSSRG